MKESDVCDRAAAWLKARGFKVYAEVWPRNMPARFDLVGLSDLPGHGVVIVEAKTTASKALREQVEFAATCADRVYAALPVRRLTAGMPHWCGILHAGASTVACVQDALLSPLKVAGRDALVRAACSRFHGEAGGLTSAAGGARLSPYRVLVYTVHERLVAATCCKRGAPIGEVIDLCLDLFTHVKDRRSSLIGLLEREHTTFRYDGEGWWAEAGEPEVLSLAAKHAARVKRERRAGV